MMKSSTKITTGSAAKRIRPAVDRRVATSKNTFSRHRAANMTEQARARIPVDPLPENTKPRINPGVKDQEIFLLPAEGQDTTIDQKANILPETMIVDLIREQNPRYAYKKVEGKVPKKLGHVAGWGFIDIAVILHRSSKKSQDCNNDEAEHPLYFHQPARDHVEYVAIKTLRKSVVERYLSMGGHENPFVELQRMQQFGDNIHILKCIEALEDDEFLYIIMPFCAEGSLKDNIPWMEGGYSEGKARELFHQILRILCYLQRHGICHHDISPDNFMFYEGRLVLFDFAMSLRVPKDRHGRPYPIKPQGRFGTFAYQSPEVFFSRGPFDGFKADLWSAAVILYNMLTGHILYYLPGPVDINFRFFLLARGLSRNPNNPLTAELLHNSDGDKDDQEALSSRIRASLNIPEGAMEVLENLLALTPSERWSIEQVMEAAWLKSE